MSSQVNPLIQLLQGQGQQGQPSMGPPGQGPMGFGGGQPGGFNPPQPQQQQTPQWDPELAPPQGNVYEIDPLVLDRPVAIRIDGSSRMLSRAGLQQIAPFLLQNTFNGPFLQGLAQNGITPDFVEFIRMIQDAAGTMREYRLFRPITPQEMQTRQQPSPADMVKLQLAQQDSQTRQSIMDKKVQGDLMLKQIESELKNREIDEESARQILKILQQENSDKLSKPDPQMEMVKLQQELQAKQQEHQLNLHAKQQEHEMKLRHQQQQLGMDLHKQRTQMAMDAQTQHQQMGLDMQNAQQQHEVQKLKSHTQAHSILANGAAKAQAARMQPQRTQSASRTTSKPVQFSKQR